MSKMEESGIIGLTITNKNITIVFSDGIPKSVSSSDSVKFNEVLKAIKEERFSELDKLIDIKKSIKVSGDGRIKIDDDGASIDGQALPEALSTKLIEFFNNNIPTDYLLAFWDNLKKNPSYRSVNQLYSFLEKNNHPFTQDGFFMAYKKVRPNFKDIHSGKFDNSVGKIVEVPRNQVDENPEVTCSYGLHVANFDYACNHFGSSSDVLVLVKVNPADVVAIPTDYNESKMRVCKYEVVSVVEAPVREPLYVEINDYYCNAGPCCDGCECDDDDISESDIRNNPSLILDIDDPDEDWMILAVSRNAYLLGDLVDIHGEDCISDKVKLAAINRIPSVIEVLDEPSDALKIAAVKLDPTVVSLITR